MESKTEITVLYVDDEEPNLFLFKANFEDKYKVLTAKSAKEALEKLDRHHDRIIVVISDMRMPEMNGVQFVELAKDRYERIYYYILTGYEYNDEIDQALKKKIIQKYFTKPFDSDEIDNAIQSAVRNAS